MRKEDLKDGMIVEIEFTAIPNERYIKLGNLCVGLNGYIDLEYATDDLCWESCKIIKIFKSKSMTWLKDINKDNKLELIWEREREIDWSKVPKWTKVQVDDGYSGIINGYFWNYSSDPVYPIEYATRDMFCFETNPVVDYCTKRECKIHPSVEIKEEWYK